MKPCTQCGHEKPEEDYYWKEPGRRRYGRCKDCCRKPHQIPKPKTLHEAFFRYVTPGDPDDCWPWHGNIMESGGYGRLGWEHVQHRAHRLAWELHYGAIPPGTEVCHACDNPPCVNWVKHLFLGSHHANMRDCVEKGRHQRKLGYANARAIRVLHDFYSTRALARMYGVSQPTIQYILKGRLYAEPPLAS